MNKIVILALAATAALAFSPASAKDYRDNKLEISRRSEVARKVWVEKVAMMSPEVRAELAESLLRGQK